jgi:hypothetical protein
LYCALADIESASGNSNDAATAKASVIFDISEISHAWRNE